MPGHWMELDRDGGLKIQQYWELPVTAESRSEDVTYYIRSYREKLEEAVESHLMSDVPLGVFLSGGVDSSAVAALMTRSAKVPSKRSRWVMQRIPTANCPTPASLPSTSTQSTTKCSSASRTSSMPCRF